MRLLRRNDDPVIVADLEMLVDGMGAAGDGRAADLAPIEPDPSDDSAAIAADEPTWTEPLDDPFVRGFVIASDHVRRYAPFYGAGLAWLALIAVVQPIGHTATAATATARPAAATRARRTPPRSSTSRPAAAATANPTVETGDASPVESFLGPLSASLAPSPPGGGPPSLTGTGTGTVTSVAAPSVSGAPVAQAPVPLRIVASGYSSVTGGTPAEQDPPSGGLPVAFAGNQTTKRSFVRLSGDTTALRVGVVPDTGANVNDSGAAIDACPITDTSWTPARGQSLDKGPAFGTKCVEGERAADGSWLFDLAPFGSPGALPGVALVPGAGATGAFQVTFAPRALES